MTAEPGVTKYNVSKENVRGKSRVLSLESKYLQTWNKSCNINEPKQYNF